MKEKLKKVIRRSVYVYRVDCGGCNGCEIEIFASISPVYDPERLGIKVVASPRHADVLLFTGPMTRPMRLPALRAYRAAPDPKIVVAYGTCGCSGGIFHDCYSVWGGADKIFPVDVYIPGCPPTPAATLYGMGVALDILQQKIKGAHHVEDEVVRVQPAHPNVHPDLRKGIEREARRLCGYLQGKQIADKYLQFLEEGDLQAVDRKVKELLKDEKDPRLVEVYLKLHQIFTDSMERATGNGG
nr:NADH-quinone oxidoreductase subunit B family protein [Calderihabitans maritimus]